jgi:crotonobetainyl-CoA:carnitine CoA-transferase CaiB-like acyl-CoA transferase
VAIRSPDQDNSLRGVIGASRHADADLEEQMKRWTSVQKVETAVTTLLSAGVPAQAVRSAIQVTQDPHLDARGFFEPVASPETGVRLIEGAPYRFGLTPTHSRLPAPGFGQHTDYVLRRIVRLSDDEIARLRESGIVAPASVDAQ